MRKNNGITLISLAILIAVILIITGVATFQGIATYRESKKAVFGAELEMIQVKVNEFRIKGVGAYEGLGYALDQDMIDFARDDIGINPTGFRYFDKNKLKEDLDIEGINREVIINFETGEVYDINGIEVDGVTHYSKEALSGGIRNIEYISETGNIIFDLEQRMIDLGRYKITVIDIDYSGRAKEGTIYYKLSTDTGWQISKASEFIVQKAGTYEVKIIDKSGKESEIKEIIASPKPADWASYVGVILTDENKIIPLPDGFTQNENVGNKIDDGIVIKDISGNEFVWVPVADLEADGTVDGTNYNQKFGRRKFGMTYTFGGTSGISIYSESLPIELTNSVNKYGGFYIARYEASYENGKVASKVSTTASTAAWGDANGRLWNHISQTNAKTKCSEMYNGSVSVVSHLVYGAEWDSTLQWFKQTVFNGSNDPIGVDSNSWGNFGASAFAYGISGTQTSAGSFVLINTGEKTVPDKRNMKNNIYDLAGNLNEWTQEFYVDIGGIVTYRGCDMSDLRGGVAGIRNPNTSGFVGDKTGFRPVLYIK